MLILIFIIALIRHLQDAPSVVTPNENPDLVNILFRDIIPNSHFVTRGVNDIVISCVATIFACTWTAMHPNIPSPCDSGWEIFKRKVITMVVAILVPEAVTAWALKQNLSARNIEREYNARFAVRRFHNLKPTRNSWFGWFHRKPLLQPLHPGGVVPWTITHGFFVQMGGFMLCKDGTPIETAIDIRDYVDSDYIDTPRITSAEIEDRSKGDGLSKGLVVLQTTWFIGQCIARWSSKLPVTELEVVTLGFAMLNALTYGLWWNKPQSVGIPVYLELKRSLASRADDAYEHIPSHQPSMGNEETLEEGYTNTSTHSLIAGTPKQANTPPAKISHLSRVIHQLKCANNTWWRLPYHLTTLVIRPIGKMMSPDSMKDIVDSSQLRVPMFYSGYFPDTMHYVYSELGGTFTFGLIHVIPAWFLTFPSRSQMLLWWVSACIVTVEPLIFAVNVTWFVKGNHMVCQYISKMLALASRLGMPLYIAARLTLIILALISLHTLDGQALITIDWISFIPHI